MVRTQDFHSCNAGSTPAILVILQVEVVPPPFTLKLMLVNPFMGSDKDGVLGINAQII